MGESRITIEPGRMGGLPCVRDLRIPVHLVAGMVARGRSEREILAAYPDLVREDIAECVAFQRTYRIQVTEHEVLDRQRAVPVDRGGVGKARP